MSARILWSLELRSAAGDRPREWVCTTRSLGWILAFTALAWTLFGVVGATWSGHRARMAQLTLEAESEENRMLRERQAALFERVFDLVNRIDSEGARLGMRDGAAMPKEAEQACRAAQYALDSAPGAPAASDPRVLADLDCDRLARGSRQHPTSRLRAAR